MGIGTGTCCCMIPCIDPGLRTKVRRSTWIPQGVQYLRDGGFSFTVIDPDDSEVTYTVTFSSDIGGDLGGLVIPNIGNWTFFRDYAGNPEHPDRQLTAKVGSPVDEDPDPGLPVLGLEDATLTYIKIRDIKSGKVVIAEWEWNNADEQWEGIATVDGVQAEFTSCSFPGGGHMILQATPRLLTPAEFDGAIGSTELSGLDSHNEGCDKCPNTNGSSGVDAISGTTQDGYIVAGVASRLTEDNIEYECPDLTPPERTDDRFHRLQWNVDSVSNWHTSDDPCTKQALRAIAGDMGSGGGGTGQYSVTGGWAIDHFTDYLSGSSGVGGAVLFPPTSNPDCPDPPDVGDHSPDQCDFTGVSIDFILS